MAEATERGMLHGMTFRQLVSAVSLALLSACSSVPTQSESGDAAIDLAGKSVPAEALNLDVRQETIQQTICVPGYTASVRPSTTYTNGAKLKLMRVQSIPDTTAADFELDH
ncbi:MAG: hypothetical protein ABI887_15930, partial [Burkholderiales bacterium]